MKTFALLFALAALGANAQVYKWTDEKGQVHYGEQPPPEAKTTTINVPPPASPGAPPAAPAADKPKAAEPGDRVGYNTPKDKAERCKYEKQQLEVINSGSPIEFLNEKKERDILPPEKREAAKKQVEANIKTYCS